MQQWQWPELQGLASTLRTHAVPLANSNLVSFDVSAVGAVAPSLTLTLSTDGEGATVKSGAMCVGLEHCVGHLNDLETHRTLLLFADDEGPDRCGPRLAAQHKQQQRPVRWCSGRIWSLR